MVQDPGGSRKTKEKSIKSLIINHYQGFLFSPNTAFHRKKTVMITGEIGGLDIYLKKSTELDHISLIFRILRGSKPTRKN